LKPQRHVFSIAVAVSLLLHALLIWGVIRWEFAKAPKVPSPVTIEMLVIPPSPPQPPPKPEPVKEKEVTLKQSPQPQSRKSARATPDLTNLPVPAPDPGPSPPQHMMGSAGISAGIGGGGGTGGRGRGGKGAVYAPSDYAEKVKARVNAMIVYPADSKHFLQQCWVQYTLTVDRNGQLLDYKIDNCGDDRLDAAAEAALIKGGPYPPPPDKGAASYEIFGAIVFTLH
jgi:protein TonB